MSQSKGEFDSFHQVWPKNLKGCRNYKTSLLQALSELEWRELSRLVRARMQAKTPVSGKNLGSKRWARSVLRRMRREPGSHRRLRVPRRMLLGRKKEGAILGALHPQRDHAWVPIVKRRKRHSIELVDFSLIDNPVATFEALRRLAELEARSAGVRVDFQDEACLDVSAYLVLGLMRQTMIRVMEGGKITPAVRAMLNALDLADYMGVHAPEGEADPTFWPFRLRHRRPAGTSTTTNSAFQPSAAEKLADELVDTINKWLSMCARSPLSRDMMGYVSRLVTEVLDNAVRHSDLTKRDGDWAMAGFLSATPPTEDAAGVSYMCSLAMVSEGATIFQSMGECADEAVASRLKDYVGRHSGRRFSRGAMHDAELLTTVFAMQDGVSRFRQDEEDSRGGVGMMDTVQFMNDIGPAGEDHEKPCMTLISGSACVLVRDQYREAPGRQTDLPRELWFNPGNTLEEPPSTAYVQRLSRPFPGTIVALRFCIGNGAVDSTNDRNAT